MNNRQIDNPLPLRTIRSIGPAGLACFVCALLSACAVLCGCAPIRLGLPFPNTPSVTLLFLAATATANTPAPRCYRWRIAAGLGLSALGDALLMLGSHLFVAGLASFLAAHLFYLSAFVSDTRLAERKLPFILSGAWTLILVAWLWPAVPVPLRLPVLLYALALSAMASQAATRAFTRRNLAATLAAIGAVFFVISDSLLALRRFNHILEISHLQVLATYFAAQAGLCLSLLLFTSPQPPPHPD